MADPCLYIYIYRIAETGRRWFPSSRFNPSRRGRAVYVVLYLKADPANARKHKEEPSRAHLYDHHHRSTTTTINVRITTTIARDHLYPYARPVNGRRHRARAMVVAASAVGLGRVQLPRQRTAKTEKKTRTTIGRRWERRRREKGAREKERGGRKEERCALQYRDHAGLRTQDGPDY